MPLIRSAAASFAFTFTFLFLTARLLAVTATNDSLSHARNAIAPHAGAQRLVERTRYYV